MNSIFQKHHKSPKELATMHVKIDQSEKGTVSVEIVKGKKHSISVVQDKKNGDVTIEIDARTLTYGKDIKVSLENILDLSRIYIEYKNLRWKNLKEVSIVFKNWDGAQEKRLTIPYFNKQGEMFFTLLSDSHPQVFFFHYLNNSLDHKNPSFIKLYDYKKSLGSADGALGNDVIIAHSKNDVIVNGWGGDDRLYAVGPEANFRGGDGKDLFVLSNKGFFICSGDEKYYSNHTDIYYMEKGALNKDLYIIDFGIANRKVVADRLYVQYDSIQDNASAIKKAWVDACRSPKMVIPDIMHSPNSTDPRFLKIEFYGRNIFFPFSISRIASNDNGKTLDPDKFDVRLVPYNKEHMLYKASHDDLMKMGLPLKNVMFGNTK